MDAVLVFGTGALLYYLMNKYRPNYTDNFRNTLAIDSYNVALAVPTNEPNRGSPTITVNKEKSISQKAAILHVDISDLYIGTRSIDLRNTDYSNLTTYARANSKSLILVVNFSWTDRDGKLNKFDLRYPLDPTKLTTLESNAWEYSLTGREPHKWTEDELNKLDSGFKSIDQAPTLGGSDNTRPYSAIL